MATAFESARIGVAKYLVPFVFVYNPSLLFEGPVWLTIYSCLAALFGVWAMSIALEGWLKGPLSAAHRLAAFVASIALMFPPLLSAFGIGGFYLNMAAAAGLAALYMVRMRTEMRTA